VWRRLAPLTALAASIGVAALVTAPGVVVALRGQPPLESVPPTILAAGDDRTVLPVLAALLQRDTSGSWAGLPVTTIDASYMRLTAPSGGSAGASGAARDVASPLIPIIEAHEADYIDYAEEFARIRDAATSGRAAPVISGRS